MVKRTTLILHEETRKAAQQLSIRYGCSRSEAIRRAVVRQRDAVLGVPEGRRRSRRDVLLRLFGLFEGHDPEDEIRRLKQHDDGF